MILRDRDTGPAPVRVVRMLAFAADTLRGTALAPDAYHGAHRGAPARNTAAKSVRWLGTGLLLAGGLLGGLLFLLAYEGCIIYQLATGPNLPFSVTLVLVNLGFFAASFTPCWVSPVWRWYSTSKIVAEPACPSGRSPARPAGVTRCCSRSSATADTRSRPPASAWPWSRPSDTPPGPSTPARGRSSSLAGHELRETRPDSQPTDPPWPQHPQRPATDTGP